MAGQRSRAEVRDEQRHEGVRRHFDQIGKPHRNAELEQRFLTLPDGPAKAREHAERPEELDAHEHRHSDDGDQPVDQRAGDGAARTAERRHAETAEDEPQVERDLQHQRADLQEHHEARFADRVRERAIDAKRETRGQPKRQDAQIGEGAFVQGGRGIGDAQQRLREIQADEADHRQHRRQPQRLPHFLANLGFAAARRTIARRSAATPSECPSDRYRQRCRSTSRGRARRDRWRNSGRPWRYRSRRTR